MSLNCFRDGWTLLQSLLFTTHNEKGLFQKSKPQIVWRWIPCKNWTRYIIVGRGAWRKHILNVLILKKFWGQFFFFWTPQFLDPEDHTLNGGDGKHSVNTFATRWRERSYLLCATLTRVVTLRRWRSLLLPWASRSSEEQQQTALKRLSKDQINVPTGVKLQMNV